MILTINNPNGSILEFDVSKESQAKVKEYMANVEKEKYLYFISNNGLNRDRKKVSIPKNIFDKNVVTISI